jgi:hypothetical protein
MHNAAAHLNTARTGKATKMLYIEADGRVDAAALWAPPQGRLAANLRARASEG